MPTISAASTYSPTDASAGAVTAVMATAWAIALSPSVAGDGAEFWSPTSPINKPLKANPTLDANSASIANYLSGNADSYGIPSIAMVAYGTPVFRATGATPRFTITSSGGGAGTFKVMNNPEWGNPFSGVADIPIDPAWYGSRGYNAEGTVPNGDMHAVIIDTNGRVFGLYEFVNGTTPQCKFGGWQWAGPTDDVISDVAPGTATGAALSRLAGVITREELAAGVIPHALVFPCPWARETVVLFPATKTDGSYLASTSPGTATNSIVESQRIFLDPTIDLDAISGITPFELMVGRALQVYGAYCIDNGNGGTAFSVQCPALGYISQPSGSSYTWNVTDPVYNAVGIYNETPVMSHIPWTAGLRVVTAAAGAGSWDAGT